MRRAWQHQAVNRWTTHQSLFAEWIEMLTKFIFCVRTFQNVNYIYLTSIPTFYSVGPSRPKLVCNETSRCLAFETDIYAQMRKASLWTDCCFPIYAHFMLYTQFFYYLMSYELKPVLARNLFVLERFSCWFLTRKTQTWTLTNKKFFNYSKSTLKMKLPAEYHNSSSYYTNENTINVSRI